ILTRDATVMCPIPIDYQLTVCSLSDNVTVCRERSHSGQGENDSARFHWQPPCPGEAMLGRMDRVAGALAGKVSHKESEIGDSGGLVLVKAKKKISWPENFEDIFSNGHVRACPTPEPIRKRSKRLPWRIHFTAAAGVKEKRRAGQQHGGQGE